MSIFRREKNYDASIQWKEEFLVIDNQKIAYTNIKKIFEVLNIPLFSKVLINIGGLLLVSCLPYFVSNFGYPFAPWWLTYGLLFVFISTIHFYATYTYSIKIKTKKNGFKESEEILLFTNNKNRVAEFKNELSDKINEYSPVKIKFKGFIDV